MMFEELALIMTKGVGNGNAKLLVTHFGSASEVFRASKKQIEQVAGIGSKTADAIFQKTGFTDAESEINFLEKFKIKPLFFTHPDYPKRLKNCLDSPAMLYYKGNSDLNQEKVVAIVGTRNATNYGKQFCDILAKSLKHHHALVVSGLAYGIDIAAHQSSLNAQLNTVGVLGHGLDRIYPALHRSTAEQMVHQGGLLTEYPSGTNPDKRNFPKRNRIIAGLADVTIVVEATKRGGALITAEIANSYNRDVFAVPGRVNDEFSEGCNFLIKTNRAQMLTRVEDLEYIMGWFDAIPKPAAQPKLMLNLDPDEQKIVDIISASEAASIDEIQLAADMPQSKIAMSLLSLEMQSIIISLPGKVYRMN